jgi:uncharacterized protein YabE (DUF348 family)
MLKVKWKNSEETSWIPLEAFNDLECVSQDNKEKSLKNTNITFESHKISDKDYENDKFKLNSVKKRGRGRLKSDTKLTKSSGKTVNSRMVFEKTRSTAENKDSFVNKSLK